ncbi:MAG: alpha/beta hydrolase [Azoarcus sp.]|nr:alpha/beta hydrolase [Azoarcus sp.]
MNRPLPGESAMARGAAGPIEILVDAPAEARGIALVCHPHPLYGGANSNKVVHTLARVFRDLGHVALRPNFRGVGASEGVHDHGAGESEDMLAVLDWARARWGDLPLILGGFSFGAYVQARLAVRLAASGMPPRHLVLVGMAAGMVDTGGARQYETPAIPKGIPALIIHGEVDGTVPLANVLEWASPQELPVVVLPGADHFFHGRLGSIRNIVARNVESAGFPA